MADIDIQRRGASTWIWWVLGLVILGLLMFWLLAPMQGDRVAVVDPGLEPMPGEVPLPEATVTPELDQYMALCAPREPVAMEIEHQHTSNCISRLANAIEATVPEQQLAQVRGDLDNAQQAAQQLAASPPDAVNHSQMARDGFTSIVAAVEGIQQQWHPQLAAPVQELRQSAEAIQPDAVLMEQRAEVQRFFAQAGEVVEEMSRR